MLPEVLGATCVIDGHQVPAWLNDLAWIALAAGAVCALFIAFDIFAGRKQKMPVMNIVWPVTCLYFGPLAVWAYWRFGRIQTDGKKPFWQTTFVGVSHCGAGCTLGDLAGEWLVYLTGLTFADSVLWTDYAIDFLLAYLLGLEFQYMAIAPMRNLSGWPGIKTAAKADTISLVAFEIGMFAWMGFSQKFLFDPALQPTQAVYWFAMQIAMIVGFATAFPANWWLLRKGLKEPM